MESTTLAPQSFGEQYFGQAELGDARRTRRLVELADSMCERPGGSLPQKLQKPAALDALYRLARCDKFTHEAVMQPATAETMKRVLQREEPTLIVHDATELDYTRQTALREQTGQIGNGRGHGYIAHNSLAVDPQRPEAIGLTGQILHRRRTKPQGEKPAEAREREDRESRLWVRGTEHLPDDPRLIDVCDSGADTFEFLEHELHSRRGFVIRSGYDRRVLSGHDPQPDESSRPLADAADSAAVLGESQVQVQAKKPGRKKQRADGSLKHPGRSQRTAQVQISAAAVRICVPKPRRGQHGDDPLPVWVVRVREIDPPAGEEPLEWLLWTDRPVETLEQALEVVEWYSRRWIIEELHKSMKTGCSIEDLRFRETDRTEPVVALLSMVAVTLLRLRDAGRAEDARTRPATDVIDRDYVDALSLWRHKRVRRDWTVYDFVMALGRLGGHQNRRGKGPPGWITLWRGWAELVPRVEAIRDWRESQPPPDD